MPGTQILICGAGPTGLVLALWLNRLGVSTRIIDRTAEPGTTSRALGVQARTLEFYRQFGIADEVVERGLKFAAANLWIRGQKVARVPFGKMGAGLSPYPYMLIYPQDEHERLLIDYLSAKGVQVERRTELLDFEQSAVGVQARLRLPDGSEEICHVDYIAGCDGAHSTVREQLGIGFPGGTYAHVFYVADAEAAGPAIDGELHVALDVADFMAIFPLKQAGRARLIGTVQPEAENRHETLAWDDVGQTVMTYLGVQVQEVNWFSTYRVHHRVAERFRQGRAFLLGDAAHIHSPAGGQGMNTGIGDAVNLAWKLAAVLQGRVGTIVLDSYEPERIAFAQRLVATTDRVFTLATSPGPIARFVRMNVVPRLMPMLTRFKKARQFMFRTVSQTAINYRGSRLSEGTTGEVKGGDRLPWVPDADGSGVDNFRPLTSLDWQVHVYGDAAAGIKEVCERRRLPLHVFPWRRAFGDAGLSPGAVYLVRPDGYIALADLTASPATLESYLDTWSVQPMQQPVPEPQLA